MPEVTLACSYSSYFFFHRWKIGGATRVPPPVAPVASFLIVPLKNLGNIGQNEPWAAAVASKLSERRPPTFFHRCDAQKPEKWYFFVFPTFTGHSDPVDPT